jgi:hypothetical protein
LNAAETELDNLNKRNDTLSIQLDSLNQRLVDNNKNATKCDADKKKLKNDGDALKTGSTAQISNQLTDL